MDALVDAPGPKHAALRRRHRRWITKQSKEEVVANIRKILAEPGCRVPADVSEKDLQIIVWQLGYVPRNLVGIAARGADGAPTVLKLHPLAEPPRRTKDGTRPLNPFPTIYWLSCPRLKVEVSWLEDRGLVLQWEEERLQADPQAMAQMQACHESYAAERWAMLSVEEQQMVKAKGWEVSLGRGSGVAGIKNFGSIKCLHAHYGDFLGRGGTDGRGSSLNLVGLWTHEELLRTREEATARGRGETGENGREDVGSEDGCEFEGEEEDSREDEGVERRDSGFDDA